MVHGIIFYDGQLLVVNFLYRSQYFICLSLFQYLWFYFINIYVYKYRCNEVPSVFQNIFLSLGTVTDNCVAISFILLPLSKRISQWYQFHSDVEDNSSCNDDYQLDYQVILHTTIYLLCVPQQRISLYSKMIRFGNLQIERKHKPS